VTETSATTMPPMIRAMLVAVTAIAVAAGAVTAFAAPPVYYETPFGKNVIKPKRIEFNDLTLKRLDWSNWGGRRARATGRARVNTCEPNCAAGNIVRGRAKLKMFDRHREDGRRVYGCMTGKATAGGETFRIQWPPGCPR
jgi:hypothetical protein